MEDEVIQFIIPMNNTQAEFLLVGKVVAVPVDEFVEIWNVTDLFAGLDVDCCSLCGGDASEGFDLTGEVVGGGTKGRKPNGSGVNGCEGCEGADRREPTG